MLKFHFIGSILALSILSGCGIEEITPMGEVEPLAGTPTVTIDPIIQTNVKMTLNWYRT